MQNTSSEKKIAAGLALAGLVLVGAGCEPKKAEMTNTTTDTSTGTPVRADQELPPPENGAMMPKTEGQPSSDAGAVTAPAAMADAPKAGGYKDGTYEVTGHYVSPAGPEEIGVKLTLKGGKVSDVSFTPHATNKKSVYMQDMFVKNAAPMVVGKSISDLNLGKVSGSSLTPKGFNEAVMQIKAKAAM